MTEFFVTSYPKGPILFSQSFLYGPFCLSFWDDRMGLLDFGTLFQWHVLQHRCCFRYTSLPRPPRSLADPLCQWTLI